MIAFRNYLPDPVTYGNHEIKWEHQTVNDETRLVLICRRCDTMVRHTVTVKGSGELIIKSPNVWMDEKNYSTYLSFTTLALKDCDMEIIKKISNA